MANVTEKLHFVKVSYVAQLIASEGHKVSRCSHSEYPAIIRRYCRTGRVGKPYMDIFCLIISTISSQLSEISVFHHFNLVRDAPTKMKRQHKTTSVAEDASCRFSIKRRRWRCRLSARRSGFALCNKEEHLCYSKAVIVSKRLSLLNKDLPWVHIVRREWRPTRWHSTTYCSS